MTGVDWAVVAVIVAMLATGVAHIWFADRDFNRHVDQVLTIVRRAPACTIACARDDHESCSGVLVVQTTNELRLCECVCHLDDDDLDR